MNNKMRTYKELEQRRLDLNNLLQAKKDLVIADLKMLQAELYGPRAIMKTAGLFISPKTTNPLLKAGIGKSVDFLVNTLLLGKASWVTRTLVSYFARNYSTHLVESKKGSVLHKISSWFKFHSHNGKSAPVAFGDVG